MLMGSRNMKRKRWTHVWIMLLEPWSSSTCTPPPLTQPTTPLHSASIPPSLPPSTSRSDYSLSFSFTFILSLSLFTSCIPFLLLSFTSLKTSYLFVVFVFLFLQPSKSYKHQVSFLCIICLPFPSRFPSLLDKHDVSFPCLMSSFPFSLFSLQFPTNITSYFLIPFILLFLYFTLQFFPRDTEIKNISLYIKAWGGGTPTHSLSQLSLESTSKGSNR